jgi:CBS domain-containing protein
MHEGCECIGEKQSALEAAKRMEQLDIGAMPICGQDDRLKGMITDRDIVVKVLAQDKDPATTMAEDVPFAVELRGGDPVISERRRA